MSNGDQSHSDKKASTIDAILALDDGSGLVSVLDVVRLIEESAASSAEVKPIDADDVRRQVRYAMATLRTIRVDAEADMNLRAITLERLADLLESLDKEAASSSTLPSIPKGWKLVPEEADYSIMYELEGICTMWGAHRPVDLREAWQSLLAAAPTNTAAPQAIERKATGEPQPADAAVSHEGELVRELREWSRQHLAMEVMDIIEEAQALMTRAANAIASSSAKLESEPWSTPASEVVKNAARYLWLREHAAERDPRTFGLIYCDADTLDAEIDAAMSRNDGGNAR